LFGRVARRPPQENSPHESGEGKCTRRSVILYYVKNLRLED
jgi:hypothetical protein